MKVQLLGTGSADGWPNAFCDCASCRWARRDGVHRVSTSAMVDGRLLLDCGPHSPAQAQRHGADLTGVRHLLITHDHPDHSAPVALLARAWARRTEQLHVHGPASVLAHWQQWTGPDDPVSWHEVRPGDEMDADGYRVRVHAAEHPSTPTVLYDVTDPAGSRLLYATDTGPLPQATVDACSGAAFDLVLLEESFGEQTPQRRGAHADRPDHLDLDSFAWQLTRLRDVGAVTADTDVVAVHLSHHNPPGPALEQRLATVGARTVPDGTRLHTGRPDPVRVLVTGGVRSGKSRHAEALVGGYRHVTYLAPGYPADGSDPEWDARVAEHRLRRPGRWTTVETIDVAAALRSAEHPVLLDCLGTWLTRVLDHAQAWAQRDGWEAEVDGALDDLADAWRRCRVPVVAVTNEVGSSVVPATASGRLFRDLLGRLNARLGADADDVVLVVAGRALRL